MLNPPTPSGVQGLIDLPGTSAKYQVWVYGYSESIEASTDFRAGRGDTDWPEQAYLFSSGSLVITAQQRLDGYVMPSAFRGQAGTVTITHATGNVQTIAVRVTGCSLKYDSTKNTTDLVGFTCQITDTPGFTGTGSQPGDTTPTGSDKKLWAGLATTYDLGGLADGATYKIDVWGVADTDAGELAAIQTILGAASDPVGSLKLRPASLQRLSKRRVQITLQWSRTNTVDDVELPLTSKAVDVSGLDSSATVAKLNGSPSTPAGDSFVTTSTATRTLSDGNVLTIKSYGLRTPKQAREFDGTYTRTDPSDLESEGHQTSVYASGGSPTAASVPSGQQVVGTQIVTINPQWKQVDYFYAKDTPQQKAEQAGTFTITDPEGLETVASVAALDGSPSTPAGLYVRGSRDQKQTHDHTLTTITCGTRTTKEDREFPGTFYVIDPNALETEGTDTQIYTGTVAPSVSPAHGTKIVATKDEAVDHVHRQQTVTLGLSDSADKLILPQSVAVVDPNALESTESTSAIGGDAPAATVSGLVLRTTKTTHPVDGVDQNTAEYGVRSTKDDIQMPGTWTETDPNLLQSKGLKTEVYTGSEPTDATPPSGQKMRSERFRDIDPTNKERVTEFGVNDSKDDLEIESSSAADDPESGPQSETATLTTCLAATTEATMAETAAAANRGTASFAGVIVKKVTRTAARVIVRLHNDDKLVRTVGFHTAYDQLKGYSSDGVIGTTTAGVRVAALLDGNGRVCTPISGGGGGYTAARLDYRIFLRTRGTVILRRRKVVSSEANVTTELHLSDHGKVNTATFLGYAATTLMYGGANVVTDWKLLGGNHLLLIDHLFHHDSLGFPNEQNLDVGPVSTATSATLINFTGLAQADTYFGASWLLTWPTAASFAGFLT